MAKYDTVTIAITRGDGSVALMDFATKEYPSADGPGWTREATNKNIQENIDKWISIGAPRDCVSWRIVDRKDIPEDRTFRKAWKPDFSVDMVKARELHKKHVRDVTLHPDIDAAKTPEELKAVTKAR